MMFPFIQAAKHGPAANLPVNRIVMHGTVSPCRDGQARATAAYFQTTTRSASAHYVVDPSEIVQCVSEATIAYQAPPNAHSIGVELCDPQSGPGSRWADDDHEAMLHRAANLVRTLCAKHNIPVEHIGPSDLLAGKRGICGHVDVTNAWHQTTHVDPGPDFPWSHFLDLVRATPTPTQEDDDMLSKEAQDWIEARLDAHDAYVLANLKATIGRQVTAQSAQLAATSSALQQAQKGAVDMAAVQAAAQAAADKAVDGLVARLGDATAGA